MISRMVDSAIKQEQTPALLPQDIPIVNGHNATAQQPATKRSLPPIQQATAAPSIPQTEPTQLPPIISSEALSISPAKTILEPIQAELPQIVPASYGAVKPNTPLPAAISHKPWSSSRN